MTRDEALAFLHKSMKNQNLRRHCYAVEAVMRALAKYFGEDENSWGIAGLLHDADYEKTKDEPAKHVHEVVSWLKKTDLDEQIIRAIHSHGWGLVADCPQPSNKFEWSLYCCDELTGFIIAVALVKGKKLANVKVSSVLKKFPQKAFAAKVNREQIKLCEEKLEIPLADFVAISLKAMQGICGELGL